MASWVPTEHRKHNKLIAWPSDDEKRTAAEQEVVNAAGDGDWVVRGESGEQWPVPSQEFGQRYSAEGCDRSSAEP